MMANCSSLVQNIIVKDENVKKFPYRIFNDLSKKLKAAEEELVNAKKFYETKITKMFDDFEFNRDASKENLNDEVGKLKQRISELTHENNR